MRRYRVLNVITRLEKGGAPMAVLEIVRRSDRSRFDVHIAAGRPEDPDLAIQRAPDWNFPVHDVPSMRRSLHPLRDLRALWDLYALIRAGRYDIVHTHTSKAGILGRIAAALCGVGVTIHSPHGTVLEGYFGRTVTVFFASIERLAALICTRIVGLTRLETQQYLHARIGRPAQHTFIYNGIDVGAFGCATTDRREVRSSIDVPDDGVVCITVGRLVPVKGHEDLLRAFAAASERCPDLYLLIVGDGELGASLRKLVEELRVTDRVRFLGWRADVSDLLAASDIFVLASHNEGLGLVIVEAMASGLPVVATSVGGVPEVVAQEVTGALVSPRAPDAMADALIRYADDPTERRRAGDAGRERARDVFSIESTVRATERLYLDLIKAAS